MQVRCFSIDVLPNEREQLVAVWHRQVESPERGSKTQSVTPQSGVSPKPTIKNHRIIAVDIFIWWVIGVHAN